MKYKCSNGHENYSESLPERCPVCGSSLIRVLSQGSPAAASASASSAPGSPLGGAPLAPAWASDAQPPVPEPVIPARRPSLRWLGIGGVAALVGLGVIGGLLFLVLGRKDIDRQMATVVKEYEDSVGVVIVHGQIDGEPTPRSGPVGTAWAVGNKVFVSNSHISIRVASALANTGAVFIILNKNPEKKFRVTEAIVHPKYTEDRPVLNFEGKESNVGVYDVGLLYVDTAVPKKFKIASDAELAKLDSGYRVAYLGFPTENMEGDGVDFRNPVANMQSGIITSVTDYWLSKAPFDKSLLLSHNLAATGGASGSPVFNSSGQVVGVLSGGNMLNLSAVKAKYPSVPERTPSAVLINFAQRIDVLREIYADYPK